MPVPQISRAGLRLPRRRDPQCAERAIHLAQVAQCSASVSRGIGKVVGDHGLRLAPRHTTACAVSQGGPPPPLASCVAPSHRRVRRLIEMDSPLRGKRISRPRSEQNRDSFGAGGFDMPPFRAKGVFRRRARDARGEMRAGVVSNQRAARRLCEPAWSVSHRLSAVPIRPEPAVQRVAAIAIPAVL